MRTGLVVQLNAAKKALEKELIDAQDKVQDLNEQVRQLAGASSANKEQLEKLAELSDRTKKLEDQLAEKTAAYQEALIQIAKLNGDGNPHSPDEASISEAFEAVFA